MSNGSSTLPPGWTDTLIGDVATVVTGKTPPTSEDSNYGGLVPFVKPRDLNGSDALVNTEHYVTEQGAKFAPLLPSGTILVSCIGNLGKTALLATSGICNQQINAILPSSAFDSNFILQWAMTIRPWMEQQSSATTVTILNKGRFEKAPLPLPPLNEQKRIVAKIQTLQSRTRKAREALEEIPALIEKFRQSVLAAAFRGDLTKDWREKNKDKLEPASELLKRIRIERRKKWEENELEKMRAKGKEPKDDSWKKKYKEPEPVDTEGLPELPEGWEWATLDELCFVKGGVTKGQKRNPTEILAEVPYLRVANVQRGYLDLREMLNIKATREEIRDLTLIDGDVLFTEGGDRDKLGRGWIWKSELPICIHQNHIFRGRPISPDIKPQLISWFGNTYGQRFFLGEGVQTTNLASVSLTRLLRLPVPLPPSGEATFLVKEIFSLLNSANKFNKNLGDHKSYFSQLDQSILAKAFRGELVPQDPNDEPASVLLERIRKERGKEQVDNKAAIATRKLMTKQKRRNVK